MEMESYISLGWAIILLALFAQNTSLGKNTTRTSQWETYSIVRKGHKTKTEQVNEEYYFNIVWKGLHSWAFLKIKVLRFYSIYSGENVQFSNVSGIRIVTVLLNRVETHLHIVQHESSHIKPAVVAEGYWVLYNICHQFLQYSIL